MIPHWPLSIDWMGKMLQSSSWNSSTRSTNGDAFGNSSRPWQNARHLFPLLARSTRPIELSWQVPILNILYVSLRACFQFHPTLNIARGAKGRSTYKGSLLRAWNELHDDITTNLILDYSGIELPIDMLRDLSSDLIPLPLGVAKFGEATQLR